MELGEGENKKGGCGANVYVCVFGGCGGLGCKRPLYLNILQYNAIIFNGDTFNGINIQDVFAGPSPSALELGVGLASVRVQVRDRVFT